MAPDSFSGVDEAGQHGVGDVDHRRPAESDEPFKTGDFAVRPYHPLPGASTSPRPFWGERQSRASSSKTRRASGAARPPCASRRALSRRTTPASSFTTPTPCGHRRSRSRWSRTTSRTPISDAPPAFPPAPWLARWSGPTVPLASIDTIVCMALCRHAIGPEGAAAPVRGSLIVSGAEWTPGVGELVERAAIPRGVYPRRADLDLLPPLG